MEILDQISPDEIEEFKIANLNGGMGMQKLQLAEKIMLKISLIIYMAWHLEI